MGAAFVPPRDDRATLVQVEPEFEYGWDAEKRNESLGLRMSMDIYGDLAHFPMLLALFFESGLSGNAGPASWLCSGTAAFTSAATLPMILLVCRASYGKLGHAWTTTLPNKR
jgi:hypothetical protein